MSNYRQSSDGSQAAIAQAIQDVTEKAQILVREEIELAKAEVEVKVKSLARGVAVGAAAGVFVVLGFLFILQGLAWFAWWAIPVGDTQFFWGFWVVAGGLFILGGLAGFLAAKAFKSGAPPTPQMAINEAKLIKETVQSPEPERTV